ncbi:GNAT family N-acetyltransferase [Rhodococcus gannanensis]|uniref:GNAT family N-acetyltransferase n=1 Tax=Rhodococcus gannanensis TaxID=1960308 RepID=A0ABW4P1C9_9NOCA
MDRLLEAMDANLASHASHLHQALPGARVHAADDLTVAASGIADDTFNLVCRARFTAESAPLRIDATTELVRKSGLPFSWWVGPASTPADLTELLPQHGWNPHESESAMAAQLSDVPLQVPSGDLRIEIVKDEVGLRDYAALMAANWTPSSPTVPLFFDGVATAALSASSASSFVVGYVGNRPVCGAEVHIGDGVAGLYGVVTLDDYRRRGHGTSVTLFALDVARRAGVETGVLQASDAGESIYTRIGFSRVGSYTEFAL